MASEIRLLHLSIFDNAEGSMERKRAKDRSEYRGFRLHRSQVPSAAFREVQSVAVQ